MIDLQQLQMLAHAIQILEQRFAALQTGAVPAQMPAHPSGIATPRPSTASKTRSNPAAVRNEPSLAKDSRKLPRIENAASSAYMSVARKIPAPTKQVMTYGNMTHPGTMNPSFK